ncbi:MAG: glutamate racemase [Candidatus Omnitrophica bacterium]|nr:glutamate racemase [Candidatus Omnitrophota bacterium]MCM8791135.1 glutamate racemase [Candidatus Omnitrophota bacterium]
MSDARPIGVFDSGVGGLTVIAALTRILPHEDIVYFGDTARVPYGTKSKETVTRFSVENIEFLMRKNVKLVIVACNTASSLSLDFLKRCFRVPILGVIDPGAKCAVSSTRNNRVGIIGTSATISSGAYDKAIKKINPRISVFGQSCPLFVPLAEEGWFNKSFTKDIAAFYLKPLKDRMIDTLILGCTHYPLMRDVIQAVMGKNVLLVDSAKEVAKEARIILDSSGLLKESHGVGRHCFFVSDEPGRFVKTARLFLRKRITCARKAV